MRRIKQHVTVEKCADIFRVKCGAGAKSSNDAKFTRQLATRLGREISVQLDTFDTGCLCHGANFVRRRINEHTDPKNAARKCFDNLLRALRFDVERAS